MTLLLTGCTSTQARIRAALEDHIAAHPELASALCGRPVARLERWTVSSVATSVTVWNSPLSRGGGRAMVQAVPQDAAAQRLASCMATMRYRYDATGFRVLLSEVTVEGATAVVRAVAP